MKIHNYSQKTVAFEHQVNAIVKISGNHPVALFDEQGLGKTKMVIAGLCNDLKDKYVDGALIICKKSLLNTWKNEIQLHSYLNSVVITGNSKLRKRMFQTSVQFYLINYESVISEDEIIKYLLKSKKMAIVLDESHKIKNPSAKITKTIFSLRDYAFKHIIISGTPIANAPEDLWAQFKFLDGGTLLGNDFEYFKDKFGVRIHGGKSEYSEKKLTELKEKIISFAIRRTKEFATPNLPKKCFKKIRIEMSPIQNKMYCDLKKELFIEIVNMQGNLVIDESNNILKKLMRLNQIASNPFLIDKSYIETPAKYNEIDRLVDEIIVERQEKVIIWSSFVENIIMLKNRYKKFNSLAIHGSVNIESRNKIVNRFQNEFEYKILIANPAAAKEGLTLTSANNAIYLDRSFNIVDYLQSQDRIHRISQNRQCNIYLLLARNSIDEYIDDVIYKKTEIAKFIQGDSKSINLYESVLTKEQLILILGEKNEKK